MYLTFSNLDALFDLNQCLTIYQSFYSSRETHLFFSDDHLFNRFGSKVKAEEKRLHNFIDLKGHLNLCFFPPNKDIFKAYDVCSEDTWSYWKAFNPT